MAKELEVKVPDIGDYKNVPVIEVLVKPGDKVEKDAPLVVLESEKATMEVPAPAAGVVKTIRIKLGDKVTQGDVLLTLEISQTAPSPQPSPEGRGSKSPLPPGGESASLRSTASQDANARSAGEGRGLIEVTVPDIGDYKDVPVIEVLVKDGDTVAKDAPLAVLESEKATMEVPAPQAGIVRGFKLKVGDKVSQGNPICSLETTAPASGEKQAKTAPASVQGDTKSVSPTSAKPAAEASKAPQAGEASRLAKSSEFRGEAERPATDGLVSPWTAQSGQLPHASPSIRKYARELGVDLSKVKGSGPKNRITREDVQSFVKKALTGAAPTGGAGIPPIPAVDFAQFGGIETKPLSRIRKISAAYLSRAWLNIPHVTQHDEADITELEAWRKTESEKTGVKLTLLPLLMKAVSEALKEFPEFNSSLAPDGENLILKKYCHLGFAADTPGGLVVPVVRDVWSKTVSQLATECGELAKKARDGKLKPDEMKGGCFSISSLGGLGVAGGFTPIVNAPEVAILGVSRATMKPVWDSKAFAPRLMLPLSLSYDHRVIDGAHAARFIVLLTRFLTDHHK